MTDLTHFEQAQIPVVQSLLMGKGELTRQAYTDDLLHFEEFLGRRLLDIPNTPEAWGKITPNHVKAYLEWLGQQVSPKTNRGYSTATIARRVTAVRELLTEAVFCGLYPKESLEYIQKRIELPHVTSEHHGAITPDEQADILENAASQSGLKGLRDYALFRLWLETGMRRAELAALKVRDLTTKEGTPQIVVRHGKGNKTRSIPLDNYTDHVIKDWLKKSGQDSDPNQPIFCQIRKEGRGPAAAYVVIEPEKHLIPHALYKLVLWYCEQAGVESKVTPHSFRATLITDARAGGATNKQIMQTTGHADARMIDAVYDRNQYNEPVSRMRRHQLPKRPGEAV